MKPRTERQVRGDRGENYCCEYLRKKGYKILARNIHVGMREIDIIAEDDKYIVFVEVKTRKDDPELIRRYGSAARAVDSKKLMNIKAAAAAYMAEMAKFGMHKVPRIDVIELFLLPTSDMSDFIPTRIHHIENVRLDKCRSRYGK